MALIFKAEAYATRMLTLIRNVVIGVRVHNKIQLCAHVMDRTEWFGCVLLGTVAGMCSNKDQRHAWFSACVLQCL